MDDEEEQQEKDNGAMKKVGKGVEQVGKQTAKKVWTALPPVAKKYILIAIAVIVVIIIIVFGYYAIIGKFFGDSSEEIRQITGKDGLLESVVKIDGRQYKFDENIDTIMEEYLKKINVDAKELGLGENLEYFKKFIEAEVVTSFPDLRPRNQIGTEVPEDQIQGIIQLNRNYEDGTQELMEYMPYDEYSAKLKELGVDIENKGTLKDFLLIGDSYINKFKEYEIHTEEQFNVIAQDDYTAKKILEELATNKEFDNYFPRGIILSVGLRDISNEEVIQDGKVTNIDNLKELIKQLQVKYPNVPIYFQKILPLPEKKPDDVQINGDLCTKENIEAYNKLVEEYCKSGGLQNVSFIDPTTSLVNEDGNMKQAFADNDGINIAKQYYKTWTTTIKNRVAEIEKGLPTETEKVYKSKAEAIKAYDAIKGYFTLNEQFELIIANMSFVETTLSYSDYAKEEENKDEYEYEYRIGISTIDYKTVVQRYVMPYEFPMAMLIGSQNSEFALAVSQLAKNGKIVISVNDNLTTINTVEKYNYHSDIEMKKDTYYTVTTRDPEDPTKTKKSKKESHKKGSKNQDIQSYYTRTILNQMNDVVLTITTANTWIVDFEATYSYAKETPGPETAVTDMGSDEESVSVEDYHGYLEDLDDGVPGSADIQSKTESITEKKSNKNLNITTTTVTNKYTKTKAEVLSKEEKFLSLLKVDPETNIFNKEDTTKNKKEVLYLKNGSKTVKSNPLNKLKGTAKWVFELLGSTEKTQSFEDTTRYLYYLLFNKDYGVTELDFSVYEPEEFLDASFGIYTGADCSNTGLSENVLKLRARVEYYANVEGIQEYIPVLLAIMMQESGGNYIKTPDVFQCSESLGLPRNSLDTEASIKQGVFYYKGALVKANYDIDLALQGYNFGHGYISYAIARGGHSEQIAQKFSKERLKGGGDPKYVEHVKRYLEVKQGGSNITGSSSEKLKQLFPAGIPQTKAQAQLYMQSISIEIINKSGKVEQRNIEVHKALADDVKAIFQEIKNAGFKAYSVGGFNWRGAAASSSRSHHSYGVAIDINPTENYMIKNGSIIEGKFWRPGQNEYSIAPNGPVVKAFTKRGWTWGGTWKSSKDYMHFSFTGH